MIRPHHAHRRQGGHNPRGIGVIPAGAIFYLQPESWWRDRYRGQPRCRDPWIVEAFLNGTLAAARCNPLTGRWEDIYVATLGLRAASLPTPRSPASRRRARPDPARGRRSALRRRSLARRSARPHCPTVSGNWLRGFSQRQTRHCTSDQPRRDDSAATQRYPDAIRLPLRQEKSWKGEWKRNLKPFEAIQRVRPPPGRGAARAATSPPTRHTS